MSDSTAIYQKFTKDVIIVGAAQLIVLLRGLILLPFIAKLLGAAAYGTWAQVHVTLGLISTVSSLGIGFAFLRFFAGETDKEKIRQGFFSILIVAFGWSCLIAIVFFLFAAPLAEGFFGGMESTGIVRLLAIILPFYTINFLFLFFFRAFREMKLFASLQLALTFIELALVAGFVLSGWGIFGAILAILIGHLLIDLVMFFLIVKRVGLTLPHLSSFAKIKDYLRFGLPLLPADLAGWLVHSSDRYVIAAFLGIASTGIYAAAYTFGTIVSAYIGPIGMVIVPTLASLYDNNQIEEVKKHLTYSLKYFLLMAIPSAVGLSLLAKPLLQVFTTAEFAAAGPIVVPFVVAAMVLHGSYAIIVQPLILVKKTGLIGIAWGIAAALNLGLNLIFIPRFGIIAAAITTLLAFAVAIGWVYYVSFKYLKFDIDWVFILKSLLASAMMAGVILLFNPTTLLDLLVVIVAGALVYFIAIYSLKGISREEILFFKRLVGSSIPFRKAK